MVLKLGSLYDLPFSSYTQILCKMGSRPTKSGDT